MSHRITPSETKGIHVPTNWDRIAETLMELDEEADLSSFDEDVETAGYMLQAA